MTTTASPATHTLACLDRGQGSPVLLVHGFPLDHRMWQPQIDALSRSHRVLAVDLAGFGQSPLPTGMLTMDRYAAGLISLLSEKGIDEPVHLAGFSMGGYVALAFMRQFARRAASLMLVDTRSAGDSQEAAANRAKLAQKVLAQGPSAVAEAMLPKLVAESTRQNQPQVVEQARRIMMDQSPAAIAAGLDAMARRPDASAGLGQIAVPTLVIVGQHDVITPPVEMKQVADAIRQSQYLEVPDAGHLTTLENPAAVNAAMASFLAR